MASREPDPPAVRRVPLASLVADEGNPRYRTERARHALAGSLAAFGPARSAVVDADGVLRAGSGTVEAALAAGIADALVVDAPDDALVVVRKPSWSRAQALAYSLADNQAADLSVNVDDLLAGRLAEIGGDDGLLAATGFSEEEMAILRGHAGPPEDPPAAPIRRGPPADLFGPWESDNPWGVPTLDPGMQAGSIPAPILKWGVRRRRGMARPASAHFYTDDHKFWGLSRNPEHVVDAGVRVAVEPNYSTWPGMARAEALWWVYSKRVVARWWQARGVKVVVDLNVSADFADLALLGVPAGWGAYATRWHRGRTRDDLRRAHAWAEGRCGAVPALFAVFGGGRKVAAYCADRGWVHVAEDASVARGKA